jgi:hypothetical protein
MAHQLAMLGHNKRARGLPWFGYTWARTAAATLFRRFAPLQAQVFSDLHLEMLNHKRRRSTTCVPNIPCVAPLLILAGDIGVLQDPLFHAFFDALEARWHCVVFVLGNHELHHSHDTVQQRTVAYVRAFAHRRTVLLYAGQMLEYRDPTCGRVFALVGDTLWSRPRGDGPTLTGRDHLHLSSLTDFQRLRVPYNPTSWGRGMTAAIFTDMHERAVVRLWGALAAARAAGLPTVVVTHFPPLQKGTSHPKFNGEFSVIKSYFACPTPPVDVAQFPNIIGWVSGHTHWTYDLWFAGVRFVSNQLGYADEAALGRWSKTGLVRFSPVRAL